MKPVLVLQNQSGDGPAYLATWLRAQGVPFEVFDTEAGQAYPPTMEHHGALALLGGEMSANDELPSLRQAERLVLDAMQRDRPVLGHCLGGQLIARALGATVARAPAPEIGWHPIRRADHPLARQWFGDAPEFTVFQWHLDAFGLPPGAVSLATSAVCPHQAFAIGPHLALQFHVELDAEKFARWSTSEHPAFVRMQRDWPATVHGNARMRQDAAAALPAQQRWADRLYRRWLGR